MKKRNNAKKRTSTAEAVAAEIVGGLDSFPTDVECCSVIIGTSNESDKINSRTSGKVC